MGIQTLDCHICLEPLDNYVIALHPEANSKQLQHIFHRSCFSRWVEENASCPICRTVIKEIEPKEVIKKRELALIEATSKGDLHAVEHLLKMGFISQAIRADATFRAIMAHEKNVAALLIESSQYQEEFLKDCLLKTAEVGDLDILNTLIKYMTLNQPVRELCLITAACHGQLSFIEKMFELGKVSEEALGGACIAAIDHAKLELIPYLCGKGSLSHLSRSKAVIKLARMGSFDLVTVMLKNGPVSDEARAVAAAHDYLNNHHKLEKELDAASQVKEEAYLVSMIEALKRGYIQEARYYIKNKKLSKDALHRCLEEFIRKNDYLHLTGLLILVNFPYKSLVIARNLASGLHHDQIVKYLNDEMNKCLIHTVLKTLCIRH